MSPSPTVGLTQTDSASIRLVGTEKPLAVEVNEMARRVRTPHFRLPGEIREILAHLR